MNNNDFMPSFRELVDSSPAETLLPESRHVILSDLHMGDGGGRDDLAHNKNLIQTALRQWYLPEDYTLVLNGDIEDLSKFDDGRIRKAWKELYGIFDEFAAKGKLRKILGNHDLSILNGPGGAYTWSHGLSLSWSGEKLFCFHGHQASGFFANMNYVSDFIVRYLAKPLRIRNAGISGDSRRRYTAEHRIYRASRESGIITITGHTHRPLFESFSKYDSLRWSIENLVQEYIEAGPERKQEIIRLVGIYRSELERLSPRDMRYDLSTSLYDMKSLLIPCMFNSGCATGKNGLTCIELDRGSICLVHWAEKEARREYIARESGTDRIIRKSGCTRYILREDTLDHVFTRIELLDGRKTGEHRLAGRHDQAEAAGVAEYPEAFDEILMSR